MKEVILRMNEQYKYDVIKNLVDTNGNKKNAAIKLQCSLRTINRLCARYKSNGKKSFVHGNRGRLPSTTFPLDIKNKIISLYINDYSDANYTHFVEIIKEDLGVSLSPNTLNSWLKEHYILSPKARRKTKRKLKQHIKHLQDSTSSIKESNNLKEAIEMIDSSVAHPRRSRCKYMGEMIQMDASEFFWINNEKWHLHVAIDDATGEVVGAYFDNQETLNGYYHVFYQIIHNYGIPYMFYTDRRTVFEYKRKNTLMDEDDTFTQFSYACHQLGVEIKTTSIAQAKGRVERLNQTLQSRLPVELRRAHITNIEEANEFLKLYLKKFNNQFALQLNSTKSVFEVQPKEEDINRILAVISERKIDSGHSIRYKNKYYIPVDKKLNRCLFPKKTSCLMIEAFDSTLYISIGDNVYLAQEIEEHERYSRNFDEEPTKEKKERQIYIPPMSHPWKHASYLNYVAKQAHRYGANV